MEKFSVEDQTGLKRAWKQKIVSRSWLRNATDLTITPDLTDVCTVAVFAYMTRNMEGKESWLNCNLCENDCGVWNLSPPGAGCCVWCWQCGAIDNIISDRRRWDLAYVITQWPASTPRHPPTSAPPSGPALENTKLYCTSPDSHGAGHFIKHPFLLWISSVLKFQTD